MTVLRIILGDQLSSDIAALDGIDPAQDVVLMMEVLEENTHVRHHKQKIALVLSAMRHFADDLRRKGVSVDYVPLDDPDNSGDLTAEIQRAVARHAPERLVVTEPGEWRVQAMVEGWASMTGRPVDVRADSRFFASRFRFAHWAKGRRTWRMAQSSPHFFLRDSNRMGSDAKQSSPRQRITAPTGPIMRRVARPSPEQIALSRRV